MQIYRAHSLLIERKKVCLTNIGENWKSRLSQDGSCEAGEAGHAPFCGRARLPTRRVHLPAARDRGRKPGPPRAVSPSVTPT